jgi:hypothetical protein
MNNADGSVMMPAMDRASEAVEREERSARNEVEHDLESSITNKKPKRKLRRDPQTLFGFFLLVADRAIDRRSRTSRSLAIRRNQLSRRRDL